MDRKVRATAGMRVTRVTVEYLGRGIEFANYYLNKIQGPIRDFVERHSQDSPWVFSIGVGFLCTVFATFAYPALYPLFDPDFRRMAEEERIRDCIQRGEDPLPYLRHRDTNRGLIAPVQYTWEEEWPKETSDEYAAMLRYKKQRLEMFQKQQAEADKAEELLKKK
eukprot:PhM_4_TR15083/c0_g1_i1/m.16858